MCPEVLGGQALRKDCGRSFVLWVYPLRQRMRGYRPIDETRIEVGQVVMRGQPTGQGALACSGWSVDRYHQQFAALALFLIINVPG